VRLTIKEQRAIKAIFNEVFGSGSIYLFGSRVDDAARGGDIDLYLVPSDKTTQYNKKITFLVKLKQEIGEQKIDLVFQDDSSRLIEQEAKINGVQL
jgi:predicted nucleotidyltransferase